MRKKYQVFISSTYRDLREARDAVSWAILKLRHIPAGMEAFPATNDRGWKVIQRTIDDSDYYILLIGARYGSMDEETGLSWTEKEYDYAIENGLPVLAFIRDRSAISLTDADTTEALQQKLAGFTDRVKANHLYQTWTTVEDLAHKASTSLRTHIDDDMDDGQERRGWIRGTEDNDDVAKQLARLVEENSKLRERVNTSDANRSPEIVVKGGSNSFSSGQATFRFSIVNVGSCSLVIERIRWFWRWPPGPTHANEYAIQTAKPIIVAPNESSRSINVVLNPSEVKRETSLSLSASAYKNNIQITIEVTARSKPYDITKTTSATLVGDLIEPLPHPRVTPPQAPARHLSPPPP
ncbi:MAG: DUF4062 domain-containing protein, partial [Myxococcales bacterium]|nr:DUF4062 domain-containing protein [Myxococcales bacterium]